MDAPLTAGWRCVVCGARVDIETPLVWQCPNVGADDRHHALELVQAAAPLVSTGEANPFLAFRQHLAWDGFAAALGMTDEARRSLVSDLDHRVAATSGTGFVATPFGRADDLSDALGFSTDGGVWVKDETQNVAGSHKARHLCTIMLHLLTAEATGRAAWPDAQSRPQLAIASCGNAALAAATLAQAVHWPISVFVPTVANQSVVALLHGLGAQVVVCPRLADDTPGDPCVHRFREAVNAGAVPFSVQGTENMWCLDGGRTIGWEIADGDVEFQRLFVQVGGGAFAAGVAAGLRDGDLAPQIHAVQTASSAPLERAWRRSLELSDPAEAATNWAACMWPWELVGTSAADGILDDETYDWIPVLNAMATSGGSPVVVSEALVVEANARAVQHTSVEVSATGTAGLAGLLAMRDQVGPDEKVIVVFSGIAR